MSTENRESGRNNDDGAGSDKQEQPPLVRSAKHLQYTKSLVAAARHQLECYFECVDALSPLMVNVDHVVDAANMLEEAETELHGGRK